MNNLLPWSEFPFDRWYGSITVTRAQELSLEGSHQEEVFSSCMSLKNADSVFMSMTFFAQSQPQILEKKFFFLCKGNFAEEIQFILKHIKQPCRNFRSPNIFFFSFIYIPLACLVGWFFLKQVLCILVLE